MWNGRAKLGMYACRNRSDESLLHHGGMTSHLVLTRLAELRDALYKSASPGARLEAEARLFHALSAVAERHRPTEVEE